MLANLELLEETLDGRAARGRGLRAALARGGCAGWSPTCCCSRAPTRAASTPRTSPSTSPSVVTEAAGELEPVAGDHEITVSAPAGREIDGARDELHRLVLNLMENALRHTDPGTAVEAIGRARQRRRSCSSVEDDGPGIPPELHDKVFERFFRGAGDRSGSSGLGLAIVRAVAESHHGTVTLEDPLDGRGARFVVRFPARHPPECRRATRSGGREGSIAALDGRLLDTPLDSALDTPLVGALTDFWLCEPIRQKKSPRR